MAYNPYYPVSYGAYQQPIYQQFPAQQTQPVQKPAEPVINASAVIPVSNRKQMEDYPIAPNAAVVFISTSEPVMYLKQADSVGRPTIQTYQRVEEAPEQSAPTVSYAKAEDLATVAQAVANMRGEIETMRGDLYGLAGQKKKTAKKQEVEEDV